MIINIKTLQIIDTDSHHKDQLRHIKFGVAQARRGWAEKEDIINTLPADRLLAKLK